MNVFLVRLDYGIVSRSNSILKQGGVTHAVPKAWNVVLTKNKGKGECESSMQIHFFDTFFFSGF